MRTRGFYPWLTDRPISHVISTTYTRDNNSGGVTDLGSGSDTGVGLGGSGGMGRPGGGGGAASSSSEPPSTGMDQQHLVSAILLKIQNFSNPCAASGNSGKLQQSKD